MAAPSDLIVSVYPPELSRRQPVDLEVVDDAFELGLDPMLKGLEPS